MGVRRTPASEPAQPWLVTTVTARHPVLASIENRDFTDVAAELEYGLDVVLRGVTADATPTPRTSEPGTSPR